MSEFSDFTQIAWALTVIAGCTVYALVRDLWFQFKVWRYRRSLRKGFDKR